MNKRPLFALLLVSLLFSTTIVNAGVKGKRESVNIRTLILLIAKVDRNRNGVLDKQEIGAIKRPKVREGLAALDADNDGNVTIGEIRPRFLEELQKGADGVMEKVMNGLDKDKDGMIRVDEVKGHPNSKKIFQFFKGFDADGDKAISATELDRHRDVVVAEFLRPKIVALEKKFVGKSLDRMKPQKRALIVGLMDNNGDNQISPAEFDSFLEAAVSPAAAKLFREGSANPGGTGHQPSEDVRQTVSPSPKPANEPVANNQNVAPATVPQQKRPKPPTTQPTFSTREAPTPPSIFSDPKENEAPSKNYSETEQDILESDLDEDFLW